MEFLLKRVKHNMFDQHSTTKLCTASLLENMYENELRFIPRNAFLDNMKKSCNF